MLFFARSKPKVKQTPIKKEGFSGWLKCPDCAELIHQKELQEHLHCCPKCDYHHRMSAQERIASTIDRGSFTPLDEGLGAVDPLEFEDTTSYKKRLSKALRTSDVEEAMVTGTCTIEGIELVLAVMDFSFMGGSMGSVVGEKFTRAVERAIEHKLPLVVFCCSGGARMQEGIFSLLQMAKTSCALAKLEEQRLPYITVLTHPTTGGVTASFASLGDIILAEPQALVCFAGPRVIEQVIGHKLPPGAQKPKFLLEHGMIDQIVKRSLLKRRLAALLAMLQN